MIKLNHDTTEIYRKYGKFHTIKIKLSIAIYKMYDYKRNKHKHYKKYLTGKYYLKQFWKSQPEQVGKKNKSI